MTEEHVHEITDVGNRRVVNIIDDLTPRYQAALERYAHGELVRWGLFMFPLPTEQRDETGAPQIIGMLGLHIEIRGAVLDTQISATRVMQPSGHSDAVIEGHARETMEAIVVARQRQLAQQEVDAKAAHDRGEAAPVAGVIDMSGARPNVTFDDLERAMNGFAHGE